MSRLLLLPASAALFVLAAGCTTDPDPGDPVRFTVPSGASFSQVTDTLAARELVRFPTLFRGYARLRGHDTGVRAGTYEVHEGVGWGELLDQLVAGRMVTLPLTIPEGFTLRQIVDRVASFADVEVAEVEAALFDEYGHETWDVPGPGLEGYLFPDTYLFAPGVPLEQIIRALAVRYRSMWTEEWAEAAAEMGMTEQEVTTLASIVQAEARHVSEMPVIAGVFHNRLRIGMPLQADPTVQYALGQRQARLLYADIDSVAHDPYNTYTHPGLPPGPIGAPGRDAFEAVLNPMDVEYLYFVARPDGTHIFTSSLDEHNRARVQARQEWDEVERRAGEDGL